MKIDAGERWADLLAAEALASEVLNGAGISAARSELIDAGGRRFLESEHFDRIGEEGRRGAASLLAVAADYHGERDSWVRAARRPFELAPVYDMLPMLFAPTDGDVVEPSFEPESARAETLRVWPRARELALRYWAALAEDSRVTARFRERASTCLGVLEQTSLRRRSPV